MTVVAMSHGELNRYDTLLRVERGELRIEDAATLLKLSRRQIFRKRCADPVLLMAA